MSDVPPKAPPEAEREQAALREREAWLSAVVESVGFPMLVSVDRVIVWVNEPLREVTGYSAEELIGQPTRMLYATEEEYERIAREIVVNLAHGRRVAIEVDTRRKDGSVICSELRGRLLDPKDLSKGSLWMMSDHTERRRLDAALERSEARFRQQQALLESLNSSLETRVAEVVAEIRAKDQLLITQGRLAAMGEMLGNIAHQWRQPLNALGLVLSDLKDAARYEEIDADAVERAVTAGNRLVQRMSATINDFRDFFRPEKERHAFSALAQIRETVSLIDASFRAAGITIEVETCSDLTLHGFANEYSQVLLNLLANAKEAIRSARPSGGKVTLWLGDLDGHACLTVADDGGGIPEAVMDKIFEPYFSTKESGSGIGLYMSRQIVERSFGGRITARNGPEGAELTVRIPLAPPREIG